MEWISFDESDPEEGRLIQYKAKIWRYYCIAREIEDEAIYSGRNEYIDAPMVDIDDDDCYRELTHLRYP